VDGRSDRKRKGERRGSSPVKASNKELFLEFVSDRELEGPGSVNTGYPVVIVIHRIGTFARTFSYREPFADRVQSIVDVSVAK